ncbi:MAG TPA: DUF3443 domain-containing protein [Candidatus Sulfotelmatobacter sp.]|nr:DUF3443 domain-containing protein [Candidatus Sulfotelmatobacter sp.]
MTSAESRLVGLACAAGLLASLFSCGGGSRNSPGPSTGSNVQSLVVNAGPDLNYANGVFTTVTVCVPGSSTCQSINGVLVDTGSFGLRVLSSALGSLVGALPQQKDVNGNAVVECAQFVSSVIWGPVKTADVQMAGEHANSIPIQVIDATAAPIPSACKAIGPAEETLSSLGANGILGVGFFAEDCGNSCTVANSQNPGFYYSCAGSNCQIIGESLPEQVQNPVAFFADDNGVMLQFPAVPNAAPSVNGSLIFGIGTQDNNALGSAQIFSPDKFGNLATSFRGKSYPSFLDSGSNAYFFLSSSATGLPNCGSSASGFYCPSSSVDLSATISGGAGSNTMSFSIGNASQLFANTRNFVFPTLGGPNPGLFDWGLPFFYGRTVFVAIEGRQTPAGPGPYWAY